MLLPTTPALHEAKMPFTQYYDVLEAGKWDKAGVHAN
jgi:hypothetical protein